METGDDYGPLLIVVPEGKLKQRAVDDIRGVRNIDDPAWVRARDKAGLDRAELELARADAEGRRIASKHRHSKRFVQLPSGHWRLATVQAATMKKLAIIGISTPSQLSAKGVRWVRKLESRRARHHPHEYLFSDYEIESMVMFVEQRTEIQKHTKKLQETLAHMDAGWHP